MNLERLVEARFGPVEGPRTGALMVEAQAVSVAVETPRHAGLEGALSYASQRPLTPGTLVRVPLGRREVAGIVWPDGGGRFRHDRPRSGKSPGACDALPPLPRAWRELVEFAAAYYQRGLGEIALSVLPMELRRLDNAAIANRLARLDKRLKRDEAASPRHRRTALAVVVAGPGRGRRTHRRGDGGGRAGNGAAARHHRQRQDRGLPARRGQGAGGGAPGAGAGARDRPDAAAGRSLRRALPRPADRRPAQRPDAGGAAASLADGAHRPGRDRPRHALAVFAPLPRLGLIVVDEEHDPSYKQQEGARYSARDLAVWRGRNESVLVRARLGDAVARELAQRRRRPLPAARPAGADRRRRLAAKSACSTWAGCRRVAASPAALAPPLVAAIEARIARGEQSLVFLNRRGYAPVLHCGECGWKSGCPHCSAWRVFHKQDRTPALPPLRPGRRGAARLPGVRQPRHRADRPRHRAARGADRGAAAGGADRRASMPTAPAGRARSRRSSAPSTPARSTSWSARR